MAKFFKKKSTRYAIPFLTLVIGGSFGLKEFAQIRYTFSKKEAFKPEEMKKLGVKKEVKSTGEVTLESEYEKIKAIDVDHWENKRGPRPWEADSLQKI
ncbi:cytochrome c oxidase assembly protein COX16 homolog, mitochondrial [Neocloeon triangulifer]|uniref:cytochrome c oxidase assembly protein COX16 homolog, mitochondrial n=1 Tax=Neocloeon triangulifer TaxID=2078957 RepID=UPI00286F6286|nr:cytochrome c oxidase assembly protein COX16 homolog, mitochondrial [Neocloeon triangulifer]